MIHLLVCTVKKLIDRYNRRIIDTIPIEKNMTSKSDFNVMYMLFGTMLGDRLGFDTMKTGMLISLLPLLITYFADMRESWDIEIPDSIIPSIQMIHIIYAILGLMVGTTIYYSHIFARMYMDTFSTCIEIYEPGMNRTIQDYLTKCIKLKHSSYMYSNLYQAFERVHDSKLKLTTCNYVSGICTNFGEKCYFYDENIKMKCCISWHIETKDITTRDKDQQTTKRDINVVYSVIRVYDRKYDFNTYFELMEKAVEDFYCNAADVELNCYDINGCNDIVRTTYYNKKRKSFEELEKEYIGKYFHQNLSVVWSMIKTVHNDPEFFRMIGQCPRVGYIFHGPAGTGKSTLIARMGITMNRDIFNIDVSKFRKRSALIKAIYNPHNLIDRNHRRHIIVFPEFDSAIKKLVDEEEKQNVNKKLFAEIECSYLGLGQKREKDIKGVYDTVNSKLTLEERDFTVRDLLEIIQGSIEIDDKIIIATTNKLDLIESICEELVRDKRMTPIYFGFLDRKTFDDMMQMYFNRKLTGIDDWFIDGVIRVPQSTLTEVATSVTIMHNDPQKRIEEFKKRITKKFPEQ